MTATAEEIRDWARSEGRDVPDRGRLPAGLLDDYDAAHPAAAPQYDGGVTEADFPAARDEGAQDERAPSRVKAAPAAPRFWRAIRKPKGKGKPRKKHPRIPVTSVIEEIWSQLAWSAAPLPPLQRTLEIQAPFAGVVLEGVVKDTIVDRALQPVARAEELGRVVSGLAGPPVLVTAMMMVGQEHPSFAMMHGMLRFSMMSCAKLKQGSADEWIARAEENKALGKEVDRLIKYIFGMPCGEVLGITPEGQPVVCGAQPGHDGDHVPMATVTAEAA
jgi:hypothetical protein